MKTLLKMLTNEWCLVFKVNQFQTYKCSYVPLFLFKYIIAYFLNFFAIKLVLLPFEAQSDGTNALNEALPEAHTHLVPAASLCSTCSHFFHETWSCKTRTWDVEADAGELRVPRLPSLWLGWALSCPTKPDKGSNLGHRLSLCSVHRPTRFTLAHHKRVLTAPLGLTSHIQQMQAPWNMQCSFAGKEPLQTFVLQEDLDTVHFVQDGLF